MCLWWLLSGIRGVRERLSRIESMLRFIIEKSILEVESLSDEVSSIELEDVLVDYRSVRGGLLVGDG